MFKDEIRLNLIKETKKIKSSYVISPFSYSAKKGLLFKSETLTKIQKSTVLETQHPSDDSFKVVTQI